VAYTVEITDPSAIGGRLPPGPIGTQPTRDASAGAPPARGEPAAEPAPPAPEPPAPEPEPVPKAEAPKPEPPKPEPAKSDAVKIEPAKKPELPKPAPKPVAAKPEPKPPPAKPVAEKPKPPTEKPAAEKPAAEKVAAEKPKPAEKPSPAAKPAAGHGGNADAPATDAPRDAYAAAAERWKSRAQGQGLGGTDTGSGPIGTGGPGPGGGGQLVGIEFLAYRQTVIATVKEHWTNVVATPGLVAAVRFEIGGDGSLAGIRLERSSGNAAYDASVLRAVQRTQQLPPPPAKYAKEFNEFVIEFHSEETGGKGAG
jgi:colicin import membrane protein